MATEDDFLGYCGWAGYDKAEEVWQAIGSQFPEFMIVGAIQDDIEQRALWEITRKLLGKDIPVHVQGTGDCVSWGGKNITDYTQCQEIFAGDAEEFHPVFAPYYYATGRVLVGKGQMRGQQGSVGSWQAKAVELYGALREDFPGVPAYSGALANKWGDVGAPAEFVEEGKKHLIRTTSRMRNSEDVKTAIKSWYGCTIASNQGFEMLPRNDGYHYPKGSWPHQMSIIAWGKFKGQEYFGILNQWGDVHGQLKDFHDDSAWPKGTLRVRREVVERMVTSGEAFAFSRFDGFPAQSFTFKDVI